MMEASDGWAETAPWHTCSSYDTEAKLLQLPFVEAKLFTSGIYVQKYVTIQNVRLGLLRLGQRSSLRAGEGSDRWSDRCVRSVKLLVTSMPLQMLLKASKK